jgi:hypothetical protein
VFASRSDGRRRDEKEKDEAEDDRDWKLKRPLGLSLTAGQEGSAVRG